MIKKDSKYKCYHCSYCCKIEKYSTKAEFNLAFEELKKQGIFLRGVERNGLIWWQSPCVALNETKKYNKCRIYDIRPLACRQFLCGKSSIDDTKPFINGNYNINYLKNLLKEDEEFSKIKNEIEYKSVNEWGKKYGYNLIPVQQIKD